MKFRLLAKLLAGFWDSGKLPSNTRSLELASTRSGHRRRGTTIFDHAIFVYVSAFQVMLLPDYASLRQFGDKSILRPGFDTTLRS